MKVYSIAELAGVRFTEMMIDASVRRGIMDLGEPLSGSDALTACSLSGAK
jgi:hypothetical protein